MTQRPSIAIVGAGPAGLTAASILLRHGWSATVFESEPGLSSRDQGGTLDLHPDTGQLALERAGLLADFLAVARHEDQETRLLDHGSGSVLAAHLPAPGEGQRPEIDRRALRQLLLDSLPAHAVCWDHALKTVTAATEARHRLTFADGHSEDFDLVIGADGAWSRVRPALTDVQLAYTGITFIELWFDAVDVRHPGIAGMVGHGTLFALHAGSGLVAQRNGGGHVRVYAVLPLPATPRKEDIPATKAGLLQRFDGWSDALLRLITDADRIAAARPIVALPAGMRWPSRAGITLVGDAAHVMPPVGVGVNLAMLDAADLASALVAASDWMQAVAQYEDVMLTRAGGIASEADSGFRELFGGDAPRAMLEHLQSLAPQERR